MDRLLGDNEHVQLELGLYVLGAQPEPDNLRVELHLARCEMCRAQCDDLGDVAELVALLSRDDVEHLSGSLQPSGSLSSVSTELQPGRLHAGSAALQRWARAPEQALTGAPSRGLRRGVGEHRERPAGGPLKRAARVMGRRPGRKAIAAVALVALSIAAAAGAATLWQTVAEPDVEAATVSAEGANSVIGARAYVEVRPGPDGIYEVRLTVVGLPPDVEFEVAANTRDGQRTVVSRAFAVGGPQLIVATSPLRPEDIVSFTVSRVDGDILVTVPFRA